MSGSFACARCGYAGAAEDAGAELAVCPGCGAIAEAPAPAIFDGDRYRYGARFFGSMFARSVVRDGADVPIARVVRRQMPARRFAALAAGSAVFAAVVLAYLALIELPENVLAAQLVLVPGVLAAIGAALFTTALLAPGPNAVLVAPGDARILLRVLPRRDGILRSELTVEDGDGATLGAIELDRIRNTIPLVGRELGRILPARGPAITIRRASRVAAGVVYEGEDGAQIATFGANPGLAARDMLEVGDPSCDRRLLVAAMVVTKP